MSRRDKQLQEIREKKLVKTTSKIYLGTITEVLYDHGMQAEEIADILEQITEKAEDLSKGYIDVDTYLEHVQEKTSVKITEEEQ